MSSLELIRERLRDIDPEFVVTFAKDLAWRYSQLYEELRSDDSLSLEYKKEIFSRNYAAQNKRQNVRYMGSCTAGSDGRR